MERVFDSPRGHRPPTPGTGLRQLVVLACLGSMLACAPTHHTVDPYRFDPQEAVRLGFRAARVCSAQRPAEATRPERDFVTDGCSVWPDDSRYVDCCVEHDILYWCGGTSVQRADADDAFGVCVADRASSWLGSMMRLGVRGGGHPVLPVPWRWGYGDAYRGGYPDETERVPAPRSGP